MIEIHRVASQQQSFFSEFVLSQDKGESVTLLCWSLGCNFFQYISIWRGEANGKIMSLKMNLTFKDF